MCIIISYFAAGSRTLASPATANVPSGRVTVVLHVISRPSLLSSMLMISILAVTETPTWTGLLKLRFWLTYTEPVIDLPNKVEKRLDTNIPCTIVPLNIVVSAKTGSQCRGLLSPQRPENWFTCSCEKAWVTSAFNPTQIGDSVNKVPVTLKLPDSDMYLRHVGPATRWSLNKQYFLSMLAKRPNKNVTSCKGVRHVRRYRFTN